MDGTCTLGVALGQAFSSMPMRRAGPVSETVIGCRKAVRSAMVLERESMSDDEWNSEPTAMRVSVALPSDAERTFWNSDAVQALPGSFLSRKMRS